MNDIVIVYETGHPTLVRNRPILAAKLRDLGPPTKIERQGVDFRLEWPPIFPGVPDPIHFLFDPWRHLGDKRRVVSVELARKEFNQ